MDGWSGAMGIDLGEADEERQGWIETGGGGEDSYYTQSVLKIREEVCVARTALAKVSCLITQRSGTLKPDRTALASWLSNFSFLLL